jgi:hypothetical protein
MVVPAGPVTPVTDGSLLISLAPAVTTVVIVVGFLLALLIVLRNTEPAERPSILRALAVLLRGRPPSGGV